MVSSCGIPSFGDEFGIGEHWVFGDQFDKRGMVQQMSGAIATKDACQIKSKAIDVVVMHPVSQAVQDPFAADGVVAVDGIAATGVVAVVGSIGIEDVVDGVFETFHREHRTSFASFAGVVEDHIEDDFNACFMEFPHQSFELIDLGTWLLRVRVASMWGKECKRIVAPVVLVLEGLPVEVQDWEFMDRQEFDGRHTEVLDVGYFLDGSEVGSRLGHPARWVFGQACKVHFVEDRVLDRDFQWPVGLPVESVVDRDAFRGTDDAIGRWLEVSS